MIRVRAPAKLNLVLRVGARRPDGYHEIETLFERIDLADELVCEAHPNRLILSCTDPTLSCGDDNLVMKAARLLQEAAGLGRGATIRLTKRIPVAAGLGGGSSDAAATLRGLAALWKLRIEHDALSRLAAYVGSDVPFFLCPAPFAIGRGRGEVCEPLEEGLRLAQVLVVPDTRLATCEIYDALDRTRAEAPLEGLTAAASLGTMERHAFCNGSLRELADGLWNDLAREAIRRCPVIAEIQSHLRDLGCAGSSVSGSGPSVFGLCRDLHQAQAVADQLRGRVSSSWRVEVVQTDHTPLEGARVSG